MLQDKKFNNQYYRSIIMLTSKDRHNDHKQEQQRKDIIFKKIKMQRTKQELIQELLRPFIKEKENRLNELNLNQNFNLKLNQNKIKMHSQTQIQADKNQKSNLDDKKVIVSNFSQQFSNQQQKFHQTLQNSKLTKKWINRQTQKLKPVFYPSSKLNHCDNKEQQHQHLTSFLQNFIRQSQKTSKPLRQQASLNTKSQVQSHWKNWDNSKKSNIDINEQQKTKSKFHRKAQKPTNINNSLQKVLNKTEKGQQNNSQTKQKQRQTQKQKQKYKQKQRVYKKQNQTKTQKDVNVNHDIEKRFQSDEENYNSNNQKQKLSYQHHFSNSHNHIQNQLQDQSIQNVTRNDLELINYLTSIKKATGGIHQLSQDQIKLKQLNFGDELFDDKNNQNQPTESNVGSDYFDRLMRNNSKQKKQTQFIKEQKNNNQKFPISSQILKSLNEDKRHENDQEKKRDNKLINKNVDVNGNVNGEQKTLIKPSKLHQMLKNKKQKNSQKQPTKNKQQKEKISPLKQSQTENFIKEQKPIEMEQKVKKWQKQKKQNLALTLNNNKEQTQTKKQIKNQEKQSKQLLSNNQKKFQVQRVVKEVQQNMNQVMNNLNKIQQQNALHQKNNPNKQDFKNKQIDFQLSFSDLSSQTVHPYAVSFSKFSDIEERKQQVNESYQYNGLNYMNKSNQNNQNKQPQQSLPTIQIKKLQPISKQIDIDLSEQIKKIQEEGIQQKDNKNNEPKKAKVRVIQLSFDQKQDTIELRQSDQLNYVSSSEEQNQKNKKPEQKMKNSPNNKKTVNKDKEQEVHLRKYVSSSEQHSLQQVQQEQDQDDQKKSIQDFKKSMKKNSQKSNHLSQKDRLQKQFLSDFTQSDISMVKSNKSLKNNAKDVSDQDLEVQKSIISELKTNVQNLKSKMLIQAGQNQSEVKNNPKVQNQNLFKQFEKKSQKRIQIDLTKQLKQMSQKSDTIPKIKKTSSKSTNKIKSSEEQNYEHLFDLNSSSQKNKEADISSKISDLSEPKQEKKQILDQFQNLNKITKKKKSQIYKDFNDHILKLKDKMSPEYFEEGVNQNSKNNQSSSKNNSSKVPSSNQTSNEVSRKGSSGASNAFSAVQQIPESIYLTNLKFSQKPTLKKIQSNNQQGESSNKSKIKQQKQIDSHSMWGLIGRAKQ